MTKIAIFISPSDEGNDIYILDGGLPVPLLIVWMLEGWFQGQSVGHFGRYLFIIYV
jgi:hypothetical protein